MERLEQRWSGGPWRVYEFGEGVVHCGKTGGIERDCGFDLKENNFIRISN